MLVWHGVPILLDEAINLICDIDRIMSDSERGVTKPRLLENVFVLQFVKLGVKLLEERGVGTGR